VIADAFADPELVAADLLGQAEHGPTSPAGLIATDPGTAQQVSDQVERLLATWPTAEVAGVAWRDHGWIAVTGGDDEAIELADEVAPEHLEVHVEPAKLDSYLERLTNYGSLFLGPTLRWSTATRRSGRITSSRPAAPLGTPAVSGLASFSRP
jgi:sulfopropanediol 3-dehydrogenase